ncbi:MAG: hypothetical protein WCS64_01035 [Dehalococcoidales bacterium]
MSMTNNTWQNRYLLLKDFISKHEEIRITSEFTRIPKNVREEFYARFDDVRKTFVEETMPELLQDAVTLSQNVNREEKEVKGLLGLEAVEYNVVLQWLLLDPQGFVLRETFDLLFGLLKQKYESGVFEQLAKQNVASFFRENFPRGFEKWVELSLIQLLKADKMFQFDECEVPLADAHRVGGNVIEEVPLPVESRRLEFRGEAEKAFILPSFTINSAVLNHYVSIRSDAQNAMAVANHINETKDWLRLDSAGHIMEALKKPGITLLYVARKPEDIALIADQKKILRPDMILGCKVFENWSYDNLETVNLLRNSLKPRIGTFIISKHAVSEQVHNELIFTRDSENKDADSPVKILVSDYDKDSLAPIIDSLKQWVVGTASS